MSSDGGALIVDRKSFLLVVRLCPIYFSLGRLSVAGILSTAFLVLNSPFLLVVWNRFCYLLGCTTFTDALIRYIYVLDVGITHVMIFLFFSGLRHLISSLPSTPPLINSGYPNGVLVRVKR